MDLIAFGVSHEIISISNTNKNDTRWHCALLTEWFILPCTYCARTFDSHLPRKKLLCKITIPIHSHQQIDYSTLCECLFCMTLGVFLRTFQICLWIKNHMEMVKINCCDDDDVKLSKYKYKWAFFYGFDFQLSEWFIASMLTNRSFQICIFLMFFREILCQN